MELKSKLLNNRRGLYLYGTTPPRQGLSSEKIYEIAEKLTARLANLNLDAINVYDIQDEEGRTEIARPFPFLPVVDSRVYAQILKNLTGTKIINYKCVVHHPRVDFPAWLDQSWQQFGLRYFTLVGGSKSQMAYPGLTLSQAAKAIADNNYDFVFGGVTIAERHSSKGNEHQKLIAKSAWGMKFFTSQVVYQPEATIQLLEDYSQQCQKLNLSPCPNYFDLCPLWTSENFTVFKVVGSKFSPRNRARNFFGSVSPNKIS